jgi:hypothetical protein
VSSRPSQANAAAKPRRRRKKRPQSCSALERKARRIRDKRKRKAALKKLPKRCRAPRRKTTPVRPPVSAGTQPAALQVSPPAPGVPGDVPPAPSAPSTPAISSPIERYTGRFGPRQAERLLWRAGFGPRPGQAAEVAAMGLDAAVLMLTRPEGDAPMDGPEPTAGGEPLDPYATWGHDHLWWMDRMVRSRHQLVERLALVFHDWFATSNAAVGAVELMLAQSNVFRQFGLGGFDALAREVTRDPAMLLFLSGIENRKGAINENYARELMELFTLGADRGAYTEADVRELARTMSGFRADWDSTQGWVNFRWDARRWDSGTKTVFGRSGAWTWEDGVRLVLEHPLHASFFVRKLWSYFVPVAPSASTAAALEALYTGSGRQVRPVLEAILTSRELYEGPAMVKPPVVFAAGLLRGTGQAITTDAWSWMCDGAGQQLFYPPDVSGWDDSSWLDTNTVAGRWQLVNQALAGHTVPPGSSVYDETTDQAVARARAFWNDPWLSGETVSSLTSWAGSALTGLGTVRASHRAQRQNALRMLLGMSPDHQVS